MSDDDERQLRYHFLDPRARINPLWWYVCWYAVVVLNLAIILIALLELVTPLSINTWPASAIAIALLVPVLIYSVKKIWETNERGRRRAQAMYEAHQPDVMGHCVECHENWPCPWIGLAMYTEKWTKASRTERLWRKIRS